MKRAMRNMKNVVKGYTDVQRRVREATSNDAWAASETLTWEIATATFEYRKCGEIMEMIRRRLNDHGKNWRHVFKSLVLIEYLICHGSEQVVQEITERIWEIETLSKFQYIDEDGRDQGYNVRVKVRELSLLLRDTDRLIDMRVQAKKRGAPRFDTGSTSSGKPQRSLDLPNNYNNNSSSSATAATSSAATGRSSTFNARSPNAGSTQRTTNDDLSMEEEKQLKAAIALSQKEEEDRQSRLNRSNYPSNPTKTTTSTPNSSKSSPAMTTSQSASTLYKEELALAQSLGGEQNYMNYYKNKTDQEDLEDSLREENINARMIGYGWTKVHRLYGVGDCGVLLCTVIRLLVQGRMMYAQIEEQFNRRPIDMASERRSLLQWLFDHGMKYRPISVAVAQEAKAMFPNEPSSQIAFQKYISKMAASRQYLSITELAAGAYRDNAIVVIVKESKDMKDTEVQGMISPPTATRVFYALFSEPGHFDILQPMTIHDEQKKKEALFKDHNLFYEAPKYLQSTLIGIHRRQLLEQNIDPATLFSTGGGVSNQSTTHPMETMNIMGNVSQQQQQHHPMTAGGLVQSQSQSNQQIQRESPTLFLGDERRIMTPLPNKTNDDLWVSQQNLYRLDSLGGQPRKSQSHSGGGFSSNPPKSLNELQQQQQQASSRTYKTPGLESFDPLYHGNNNETTGRYNGSASQYNSPSQADSERNTMSHTSSSKSFNQLPTATRQSPGYPSSQQQRKFSAPYSSNHHTGQ